MEETKDLVDNLNREKFVNNTKLIINTLADNKKNATFAINGEWGVGKTWILDKLEEEIKDNYLVIRYNAWENDFYEEPLIAILSVFADKMNNLLKSEHIIGGISKQILKKVVNIFKDIGAKLSKHLFGIDIVNPIIRGAKATVKDIKDVTEEEKIEIKFDNNLSLQQAKNDVRISLSELSKDVTIIVMVDELDRCLPEYAIKVLERLHHVFDNIPNLQVIISVDKGQLNNTVKTIFGMNVVTEKYLSKFIDFELELSNGEKGNNFDLLYKDYCKFFDYQLEITKRKDIDYFKKNFCSQINARQNIKIIEQALMIHEMLLDTNKKYDYIYFCIELTLVTIFRYNYGTDRLINNNEALHINEIPLNNFACYVQNKDSVYKNEQNIYSAYGNNMCNSFYINDIWGAIWAIFALGCKLSDVHLEFDKTNDVKNLRQELQDVQNYFYKVIDWLKFVK